MNTIIMQRMTVSEIASLVRLLWQTVYDDGGQPHKDGKLIRLVK